MVGRIFSELATVRLIAQASMLDECIGDLATVDSDETWLNFLLYRQNSPSVSWAVSKRCPKIAPIACVLRI